MKSISLGIKLSIVKCMDAKWGIDQNNKFGCNFFYYYTNFYYYSLDVKFTCRKYMYINNIK